MGRPAVGLGGARVSAETQTVAPLRGRPVTPDTRRALDLVREYPGELDAEALAAHLWPPPRLVVVPRTREEWRARVEAVEAHRRATAAQASAILARLTRAGLVERRGPPRLAAWFLPVLAKRGPVLALAFVTMEHGKAAKVRRRHLAMLEAVRKCPPSMASLGTGRPAREAYRDLVAWSVVIPPSRRFPVVVTP